VRGLPFNLVDYRLFKYASIDTNWRPSGSAISRRHLLAAL
jgi:hypothetical protein